MMGKLPALPEGYRLRKPCKNCPFAPTSDRIVFSCKERAEEISEGAYRNGFPCHLSADDTSDEDEEGGGYVFGKKTQHCAGAVMMFIRDDNECGWPGIGNDEGLAERLEAGLDWAAPHYQSEEDFVLYGVQDRRYKDGRRPIPASVWRGSKK